jgi:hypothetical protein
MTSLHSMLILMLILRPVRVAGRVVNAHDSFNTTRNRRRYENLWSPQVFALLLECTKYSLLSPSCNFLRLTTQWGVINHMEHRNVGLTFGNFGSNLQQGILWLRFFSVGPRSPFNNRLRPLYFKFICDPTCSSYVAELLTASGIRRKRKEEIL